MQSKQEIKELIHVYHENYPGETSHLYLINSFIDEFEETHLYSRNNFVGHLTASAFIYHPHSHRVLFIRHTALNRWLQPGGHIELTDKDVLSAALREAEEETGIEASLFEADHQLFDVDSHSIPANNKKNEPAHVHHDLRFLLLYNYNIESLGIQSEVSGCEWLPVNQLTQEAGFEKVMAKLNLLAQG